MIGLPFSGRLVEDTVLLTCSGVLVLTLLWLAASAVVCLRDVATGRLDALARGGLLRPRLVRALVVAGVGLLAAGGLQPTQADTGTERPGRPPGPTLPRSLEGLSLPDRPYGGLHRHPVRAGESLWTIAADTRPTGVDAATGAREWPRIYRLNRARIGSDPDLIHPGTVLRLPPRLPAQPPPQHQAPARTPASSRGAAR